MHLVGFKPTEVFQALSDETRFRIIRLLASPGITEACSCDLAEVFEEPEYTISRQLKILRMAGLLSAQKEGKWIYHQVQTSHPDLQRLIAIVSGFHDSDSKLELDRMKLKRLILSRSGARCTGRDKARSPREKVGSRREQLKRL
jgi:ArsR family transcriptional regulator